MKIINFSEYIYILLSNISMSYKLLHDYIDIKLYIILDDYFEVLNVITKYDLINE